MAAIRSFRDLKVYRQAVAEARNVFVMSGGFPSDERYSLTDQVRRSSRAVGAMIAEAWARRRYPAAFCSKLNEALGEAMETQCWLDHALCCRYLGPAEHRKLDAAWQAIGAMIQKMVHKADDFCRTAAN
jgi:four helix bundle protein